MALLLAEIVLCSRSVIGSELAGVLYFMDVNQLLESPLHTRPAHEMVGGMETTRMLGSDWDLCLKLRQTVFDML